MLKKLFQLAGLLLLAAFSPAYSQTLSVQPPPPRESLPERLYIHNIYFVHKDINKSYIYFYHFAENLTILHLMLSRHTEPPRLLCIPELETIEKRYAHEEYKVGIFWHLQEVQNYSSHEYLPKNQGLEPYILPGLPLLYACDFTFLSDGPPF